MKKSAFFAGIIVLLLSIESAVASEADYLWDKTLGGSGDEYGFTIAKDASGNIYIAGLFEGTVDFGGGNRTSAGGEDAFIVKLDNDGNYLWDYTWGSTSDYDIIFGNTTDSFGDIYVSGSFTGTVDFGGGARTSKGCHDIVVVKLDTYGNYIWDKTFGNSSYQTSADIKADDNNNVIVTGYFYGTLDFGGGSRTAVGIRDIYIVKLSSDGDYIWDKTYGGISQDCGRGIAVDADNNVYVTGHFERTINFGGGNRTEANNDLYDIFVLKCLASTISSLRIDSPKLLLNADRCLIRMLPGQ